MQNYNQIIEKILIAISRLDAWRLIIMLVFILAALAILTPESLQILVTPVDKA